MNPVRPYRLLLAASILVPALVFLGAAVWSRSEVLRESDETVVRADAVLHEHARKVFDTVDLVLGRVDDRVSRMTWDEIDSPATSAFLHALKEPLEQAVSIWVTDATGRVRAGSQPWDPAVRISEREWFQTQQERDAGTYISGAFQGKATKIASFAVSRRITTTNGHFGGIIHVALSPEYFARFAMEVTGGVGAGALLRADGEVLSRFPYQRPMPRVEPSSPLMRIIAARPQAGKAKAVSTTDGKERYYAYQQVAPYPVFAVYGLDTSLIDQRWLSLVAVYGVVAAASALVLFAVSWLAMRSARAEQMALVSLRAEHEQRVAAEQRLLQAQKMESLGQLTGGIAHDFNNLLAVIIGNLDLLQRRVKGDDRAKRLLESAMQGAERGAALTQRMLAFSRRQDLSPQPVNLHRLIGDMTDLLERSLGPTIRIDTTFADDLPPALADPNQLEMALLNLAVNARDAMGGTGRIVIAARTESAPEANSMGLAPGHYCCLSVTDTGAGMTPDTLARAVEPFFTTKGVGKGTGLGLSMIHGFAEQSGGALRLKSAPGAGTTAELWLPIADAPPQDQAPAPGPASLREPCRVLLVEDDPLVLAGASAMLEDLGHTVAHAASGEEAAAILDQDSRFDLVVTDYAMPGMTGLELADRIRARWPEMPVLLASGHAELNHRPGVLNPRLPKPYTRQDLAAAIASTVSSACRHAHIGA